MANDKITFFSFLCFVSFYTLFIIFIHTWMRRHSQPKEAFFISCFQNWDDFPRWIMKLRQVFVILLGWYGGFTKEQQIRIREIFLCFFSQRRQFQHRIRRFHRRPSQTHSVVHFSTLVRFPFPLASYFAVEIRISPTARLEYRPLQSAASHGPGKGSRTLTEDSNSVSSQRVRQIPRKQCNRRHSP